MKNKIQIIIPKGATEEVELDLVRLTKFLCKGKGFDGSGGLGGEYGYGVNYENDVFMIHRFCWCGKTSCPWCSMSEPNFYFKPTKTWIRWYKWIGRDTEQGDGKLPKNWLSICKNSVKR